MSEYVDSYKEYMISPISLTILQGQQIHFDLNFQLQLSSWVIVCNVVGEGKPSHKLQTIIHNHSYQLVASFGLYEHKIASKKL